MRRGDRYYDAYPEVTREATDACLAVVSFLVVIVLSHVWPM